MTPGNTASIRISHAANESNRDYGLEYYFMCGKKTYMGIMGEVYKQISFSLNNHSH